MSVPCSDNNVTCIQKLQMLALAKMLPDVGMVKYVSNVP